MAINPDKVVKDMLKLVSTDFRPTLDKDIHVVDISYDALRVSDPKLSQETYTQLISALLNEYPERKSLKAVMGVIKDPSSIKGYTALVNDPQYGVFIVSKTYQALQAKVSKILKSIDSTSEFTGVDERGITVTNIGHIPNSFLDAGRSPLSEKINKVIARLPLSASKQVITELYNLYNTHTEEASYSFSRNNYDTEGLNKILGKGTVLVTLHSAQKNNEFAKSESSILNRISRYLTSDDFLTNLVNTPGSNTVLEDIREGIKAALMGERLQSAHSKKPTASAKKTVKDGGNLVFDKTPTIKLRTTKGQFYSLASLQNLINSQLQDVISANMGDGNQRRVLNYRTGRFAASARVDRLSQGKDGAITAFYTYMKNPYATFSEGGMQEYPRTRDPKLLISTSIKQIAAEKVANRMRAVLV